MILQKMEEADAPDMAHANFPEDHPAIVMAKYSCTLPSRFV